MTLNAGDELALIPPVSGGSVGELHTRVTDEPLRLDALVDRVRDPRAGAVVTFLGVTREVAELDYEAYAEMAERKIAEIVRAAVDATRPVRRRRRAPGGHRAAVRAVGRDRGLGSASRRGVPGAREIIDEIKAQAPIWKKEEGEWVRGTTPEPPPRPRAEGAPGGPRARLSLEAPHPLAVAAARGRSTSARADPCRRRAPARRP